MLLRLPWLISRRRLLLALLVDSLLFAFLYTTAFLNRFEIWPQLNLKLAGLLGFWLVCSYVIGRYYSASEPGSAALIKQVIRTLGAFVLSLGVFMGCLWLLASPSQAATSRSFMLPLLVVFALLSGLLQQGFNLTLKENYSLPQNWVVVGSAPFQQQLVQALAWSRIKVSLESADLRNVGLPAHDLAPAEGLVVEGIDRLPEPEIDRLLHLRADGFLILTPVAWCEQVLQRFPPALVTREDLLRGQFTAPQGSIEKRLKRLGDVLVSALLLLCTCP